jgi:D-cysteine desulfhydrase family pyridoxal phosphate-dependent enzyme
MHPLPHVSLGHYPTPIEELPRLRQYLGSVPRLYVKRDDLTGAGFGGNKVRKLEYLLADALAQSADAVITCGGRRSNHCRITAACCARLGLECHLILNRTAGPENPASLYLNRLYGAHLHFVENRADRSPEMERVAADLRAAGQQPYIVPLGGSVPLGALGFLDAARELASQVEQPFDAIYACSSSGGTQAGLDAGLQLAGWRDTRLVCVSPDDGSEAITGQVAQIRRGLAELAGRAPAELERPLEVNDRFAGPGYGIPTPESEAALELLARLEGLVLDPVYTAKTMAAMLMDLRSGRFDEQHRVLFWHTGGQIALFTAE